MSMCQSFITILLKVKRPLVTQVKDLLLRRTFYNTHSLIERKRKAKQSKAKERKEAMGGSCLPAGWVSVWFCTTSFNPFEVNQKYYLIMFSRNHISSKKEAMHYMIQDGSVQNHV